MDKRKNREIWNSLDRHAAIRGMKRLMDTQIHLKTCVNSGMTHVRENRPPWVFTKGCARLLAYRNGYRFEVLLNAGVRSVSAHHRM